VPWPTEGIVVLASATSAWEGTERWLGALISLVLLIGFPLVLVRFTGNGLLSGELKTRDWRYWSGAWVLLAVLAAMYVYALAVQEWVILVEDRFRVLRIICFVGWGAVAVHGLDFVWQAVRTERPPYVPLYRLPFSAPKTDSF
jgi:hypothetical protein